MPAIDSSRDYYADLQLPPTADVAEIKKQFRKLALLYHPDRNPGKEAEVNSKFQTIQSAHEILSDPQLKAKYDASRPRSRYPTASGVKGNPWQNAGSHFPPPPRRTGPTGPGPTRNPPPSGAQKYRNFAGAAPTAKAHPHAREDHMEAKRNAWHAFEQMRPNSQGKSAYTQAKASRPPEPPPTPSRPVPRTPAQKERAEAAFGAKTSQYVPQSPVAGDEPPARSPASHPHNRHTYDPAADPSTRTPRDSIPDPLAQFRGYDKRQSSPYHSSSGERTNPFDGATINRTKSTRETSRRDQHESAPGLSAGSPRHHRSSSAPRTARSNESGEDRPSPANPPNPLNVPRPTFPSRASARYTPPDRVNGAGATINPTRFPTDTKPDINAGGGQSPHKTQGPSMYGTPTTNPSKTSSFSASASSSTAWPPAPTSRVHGFEMYSSGGGMFKSGGKGARSSTSSSPSGDDTISSTPGSLTPFERQQGELLKELIKEAHTHTSTQTRQRRSSQTRTCDKTPADKTSLHSFSFPINDDTFTQTTPEPKRFTRTSTDDINTKFANDQGSEAWQFKAGGPQQEDPFGKRPAHSGSRAGRESPLRQAAPPRPAKEPLDKTREASPAEAGFDAQGWGEQFGPQVFAPQPTRGASASPTRPSRSSTRKHRTVHPTMGTAGMVNEDSSGSEGRRSGSGSGSGNGSDSRDRRPDGVPAGSDSPMAMDIDPPSVKASSAGDAAEPKPTARNIPVEPSRPEWRPGDVKGMQDAGQANGEQQKKSAPKPHVGGSEDSEEFRATLADLKNVAPFAQPPATGLGSFSDLKTNLPFESKASDKIPIAKEKHTTTSQELNFPLVPQAPTPPPTLAVSGLKPTLPAWQKYLVDFQNYMQQWDAFTVQVTEHFNARKEQILRAREARGYAFLAAQSDSGIEEYLEWLRQDQGVRRKWTAACESHEGRVREFLVYRQKMR
ncbi:hypothetical protein SODALDRAFT_273059 [Sodiomyces alkalinus F11]|uniref:J domain-containing protein n=1 Tax=Sodiomyces alkalinus (strain CBS 110278 / VKM F-3762 / F11) TaxID=1314773 RepID=A0A3N2Q261_SODAK|nr:hypothetical protein SODALDRAFT_273059 [Sodiomyces alkalinus F11]ROT40715.1 hypothetical protein SODALDRAFT_273059 [Sodiomyces alkalinus F11]